MNKKIYIAVNILALVLFTATFLLWFAAAFIITGVFIGSVEATARVAPFLLVSGGLVFMSIRSLMDATSFASENGQIPFNGKYKIYFVVHSIAIILVIGWYVSHIVQSTNRQNQYIDSISNIAVVECLRGKSAVSCISDLAYKEKNVSLCKYVDSGTESRDCYTKIFQDNDISVCGTIGSDWNWRGSPAFSDGSGRVKDFCYTHFALKEKDPNICYQLKYEGDGFSSSEANCLTQVAVDTKNLAICDMQRIASYRDDCLQTLATTFHDLSICPKLSDINSRSACEIYVNRAQP